MKNKTNFFKELVTVDNKQLSRWEHLTRKAMLSPEQTTLLLKQLPPLCEDDHYRAGVMDAFCEIVKAGVKKIAFSHATDDEEVFQKDLQAAFILVHKYQIHMYVEDHLLETILFKNSGQHVIIFYSDPHDLQSYLALKQQPQDTITQKQEVAMSLGTLLSYDTTYIKSLIDK